MGNIAILMICIILLYIVLLGVGILNYVLSSLSLYTIAKRRQINNPWLAWIPFASYWTMGCIADDYDARMGIKRKWRVILLTLSLVFIVTFFIFYFSMLAVGISFAMKYEYTTPSTADIMGIFIPMYIFIFIIALSSVAFTACNYICMFKIYESTVPQKALKYFLLSLLVPCANAICLFLCRNEGYSNIPVNPYIQNPQMYYPQNNQ